MRQTENSTRSYSSNRAKNTRVKVLSRKKTVGITLPRNLVEKARKHNLNISRITEQALSSILDYLEAQNTQTTPQESSAFLGKASFLKEGLVPRVGFEPATRGDITRR